MTDFKYKSSISPFKFLPLQAGTLALAVAAFSSIAQFPARAQDNSDPFADPQTITNQPAATGSSADVAPASQPPSLFRGTVGASDGLFSGPVDPDTQDSPSLSGTANGEGSRLGLPRQGGEIQPGQRDDRRVTRDGRIVRRGQAGYATAQPVPAVPPVPNINTHPRQLFRTSILDTDIDPDLREAMDDDLQITDNLPALETLTGPTVGASRLLRGRGTLKPAGRNAFTVARRQDYPSIDDERPYDPLGLRIGSFRVLPTLTTSTIVTDNVANAAGTANSDIGLELASTLRIESDWNRHALSLDANATAEFYNEFDDENSKQFAVVVQSRLDLTLRTNIELDAGYQLTTEERGSANASAGAITEPDVETFQAGATFNHRFNRLVTRTRVGYTKEINGDAELAGGGVDFGSDEDFSRVDLASRLTYEFSPSFAAFVEGGYNRLTFDVGADSDGILRDSKGYEIRVGAITEIGPAIRAELSVGYATQISEDSRLADVEGFVFDADVLWRPSALTSVNLTAQSDINSSTLSGSLGSIEYQTALNIRHEFRRYAIGTLGFGWRHEDFQGSSTTEDEFTFQMGGEYIFSRNLAALASYQFTDFNTSRPVSDYQSNEFRLGLQVRR